MGEPENANVVDVAVAGGGIVGCLAAARLRAANPTLKIVVLEKDAFPGGRLRSTNEQMRRWSCGLDEVTPELFEFIRNTFRSAPDANDLPVRVNEEHKSAGVLSGGKLATFAMSDLFAARGARKIGGTTAQNAWEKVDEVLNNVDRDEEYAHSPFAKVWKHTRKNPATIVLEHFANSTGITDIWSASVGCIKDRARMIQGGTVTGDWENAIADLCGPDGCLDGVRLETNCRILNATRVPDEGAKGKESVHWTLETEKGDFTAKRLIVAQAPWLALDWLPKDYWPTHVLEIALKTRPISLVVLSEVIDQYVDLPDMTIITSEKVYVSIKNRREICFKTPIDFEVTLDAPEVVKAVKRLKRARKKLLLQVPDLKTHGEHLELLPIAWPQSPDSSDNRYLSRLEKKSINGEGLAFCGDAYGGSYDGDANLRRSVIKACQYISGEKDDQEFAE